MATDYCRSMLRICIAQLCQNLGWNATQSSPLELLTDILERYLIDLGKISHRYSEQFGRTEPNLDDLALTFRHYGIQLGELEDYIRHVEPVAFAREVVSFPARKRNNLGFPNPRSRELQHREEHVHDHLPYMFPGMEDEVEEETSQASTLPAPQLPQESVSPMAISPNPSEKRPLSNSAEGPQAKRPRLTSSNLPEEAGHSQYEMKSLLMNPSGVLTPTRQGKLPDARTPPTFRQSLQFADDGPQKGRDYKDGTPTRSPFTEKSRKEDDDNNKSNNCSEKVAPKKKMLKHYKQMTGGDSPGGMPRSPKVTKLSKSSKPGSPLATKSPKGKLKGKKDKKDGDGANESCLKDLLLSPKVNVDKVEKTMMGSPLAGSPSVKSDRKDKNSSSVSTPSRSGGDRSKSETSGVPQLPFSVDSPMSQSGGDSPERLIIAEGETRVKNTKEAKQARLALIDDSIDSVIRNSMADADKKPDLFSFPDDRSDNMSPKPGKGKKKEKNKLGKDSAKKKDKKGKFESKSMSDSIDVVRQSSEESEHVPSSSLPATPVRDTAPKDDVKSSSAGDSSKKLSKDKFEKKKKKAGKGKDKESSMKEKLKDKIKHKSEKADSFEFEKKPSVLDKFSAQEYSVYDFPESPPSLPLPRKKSPKAGMSPKQVPPAPAPNPTTSQTPPSRSEIPPVKDETPSTPAGDQPAIMTLKIHDLKHGKKAKDKSKDKEHKKEKKDKKKDKEKKKKNKDKDKEKSRDKSKSREDKHRDDKHRDDKDLPGSSPGIGPIKLNIKFGGSSSATSTVITETKMTSPKTETIPVSPRTPRAEPLLSPKREIPKLVIKPIRRESLEAKAKLGAASRSPALMSPPKSPTPPPAVSPPKPKSPSPAPAEQHRSPSPPPRVPTPPVVKPPPSPSPPPSPPREKTPPKSPSPSPPPRARTPPQSPPSPMSPPSPPPPKSPTPISRSPSPPPRSPTPEKLLTPSPEPKNRSPASSPIRRSPSPEPSPPPKSPARSPSRSRHSSPASRRAPSPKSSAPSTPLSSRLEMDIDDDEPEPKPKPKPKQTKQSPKGKADKANTNKSSPKGKRGRKPKDKDKDKDKEKEKDKVKEEKKEEKEDKAAVRSRNKSIPTVTSETVSETPITGPIVSRTVVAETIGTFLDADGNKVWICPSCKMQDDGSPMIGCDNCDDWYHWECMNIKQEPDTPEWYCPRCEENRKSSKGKPKGKKRGRKKKTS